MTNIPIDPLIPEAATSIAAVLEHKRWDMAIPMINSWAEHSSGAVESMAELATRMPVDIEEADKETLLVKVTALLGWLQLHESNVNAAVRFLWPGWSLLHRACGEAKALDDPESLLYIASLESELLEFAVAHDSRDQAIRIFYGAICGTLLVRASAYAVQDEMARAREIWQEVLNFAPTVGDNRAAEAARHFLDMP